MGRPSRAATTPWSSRPTGSGKTLAAFLWAIDQLAAAEPRPPKAGTRVLYISPLKALAVDVERNLSTPLTGITRVAERLGVPVPQISVGVRSGDTPPAPPARADHQAARHPHHHARVAVPDADVGGQGDPRRGARP